MTDNPAAALEQPFAALQNRTGSAGELKAAAEAARAAVRALDAERELAPEREAKILSEMTPPTITPGIPPSRGRSIAETVAALVKLDDETSRRTLDRKIAVGVAEQLDRLARSAAKAEAERDEKRKPFAELTRRAQEYALRVADAARVPSLFRTDCVIAQLGGSAYSRTPSPNGSHVRNERTFNVPRTIATEGILKTTKLPGFWPPRWSDYYCLSGRTMNSRRMPPSSGRSAICVRTTTSVALSCRRIRSTPPWRARKPFWSPNSTQSAPRSVNCLLTTPR
jgi:hypothetical protein